MLHLLLRLLFYCDTWILLDHFVGRSALKYKVTFVHVLLGFALLLFTSPAFAQGTLGTITGTVQDTSGAVVPDLPLTITNVETGVKWTATTSSAGYYRVAVPPGTYRLEAQKQGFKTQVADKIDRKSTRLNSSHVRISYAVFYLKKKKAKNKTCCISESATSS